METLNRPEDVEVKKAYLAELEKVDALKTPAPAVVGRKMEPSPAKGPPDRQPADRSWLSYGVIVLLLALVAAGFGTKAGTPRAS